MQNSRMQVMHIMKIFQEEEKALIFTMCQDYACWIQTIPKDSWVKNVLLLYRIISRGQSVPLIIKKQH